MRRRRLPSEKHLNATQDGGGGREAAAAAAAPGGVSEGSEIVATLKTVF